MKFRKLKWALACILGILLCAGYVAKAQPTSPPTNNNCQNATAIGEVVNRAFNTTNATFDGPGYCMTSPNIWYRYTATRSGNATVSLCGSSFDTVLAVYRGVVCYPQQSNMVGCNDDACGRQSELSFGVVAGSQYLIEVGGFGANVGQGVLTVSLEGEPEPPPSGLTNNDCRNATQIGNVTNLEFDTSDATFDGPGHCVTSPNIWYCYTAPRTGNVTVSLCGSSYDTKLAVYNGCTCYPSQSNMIKCNDDFCGLQSEVTFEAIGGNRYLIEIGGCTDSDWGAGVLNIRTEGGEPTPSRPANDNCSQATSIGNVTRQPFSTVNATFDGGGHCMASPNIWYSYTATCTGDVTVSLCGSSYDTKLGVYNKTGCPPRSSDLIKCNDDACGWQSEVTFAGTVGSQYLIEVGGFGSSTGQGVISIRCEGMAQPKSDIGDAPDSSNNFGRNMTAYPKGGPSGVRAYYPTVFSDGSGAGPYGPIHLDALAVAHLGKKITHETEADKDLDEDGVNNIEPRTNSSDRDKGDDGVTLPLSLPKCSWTTFDYFVNVIDPDTHLWVNVWCDWNRDGDWDDDSNTNPTLACSKGFVSEWVVRNQYIFNLPAGLNQLTTPAFLPWHPATGTKQIWMRITVSKQPWIDGSAPGQRGNGGSGPEGGYEIGETEDYYFTPDTTRSICEDYNGDGKINLADLSAFTTDWLEYCPQ